MVAEGKRGLVENNPRREVIDEIEEIDDVC